VEITETKFLHRRMLYMGTSYPGNCCTCLLWVLKFTSNPQASRSTPAGYWNLFNSVHP